MALPSFYEGFGLPAIEALRAGAPLVASDLPVLREVAGDAALYAPPDRPDRWAERLGELLADPGLRLELRRAARPGRGSSTGAGQPPRRHGPSATRRGADGGLCETLLPMTRATLATLATAAVLAAGALTPEPPRVLQALTAVAMLGALGMAGDRLARWLCPGFEILSHAVAAFTFAVALAVVPATWMGQWGMMRPAPFLLWVAAALLLSRLVPVSPRQGLDVPALAGRRDAIEWTLWLAAAGAIALVGLKFLYHYRWVPVGLGPDDESYHLAAVAVWHRFGDLRMIKFAVGDTSTTFYPVGGEVWSWGLLAPFRDSDFLTRFAQLPFALFSFAATASIGRRLGLSLRSALLSALLFAAIRRVFPVLALQAGNDHSASFFTLAAIDGVLALAARPRAGVAIYSGAALGLLLGTKYTGLLFGPTVIGLLLLIALGQRLRALAGLTAVFAVAAAVAGGYTYLRNWATTGNPVFPVPVSLFGRSLFPGWEAVTVSLRNNEPWFRIDLWHFLLDRRDLLGAFFPYTLLPAALVAPLVALGRRRWRDALVLTLPVVFFLEFLYLMPDHRDMRYFMPGVALAAVGFAWLVEQAGTKASAVRAVLLLALTFHVTRKLDFGSAAAAAVAVALMGLGWLAFRRGPRLLTALNSPAPQRWLAVATAAAMVLSALPLAAAVDHYQAVKLTYRLPRSLSTGWRGRTARRWPTWASTNRTRSSAAGYRQISWCRAAATWNPSTTAGAEAWTSPFEPDRLHPLAAAPQLAGDRLVVVHRSPWENPERSWMAASAGRSGLEFFDRETEIAGLPKPGEARHQEDLAAQQIPQGHRQQQQQRHRRLNEEAVPARLNDESGCPADGVGEPGHSQGCGGERASGARRAAAGLANRRPAPAARPARRFPSQNFTFRATREAIHRMRVRIPGHSRDQETIFS